jgi:hypothetical protein
MINSLIRFWLILLAIFTASSTPSSAQQQSERYVTATEVQILREKLRQQIQAGQSGNNILDRRSLSEKQTRESFVRSWLRIDASVAPFLGNWVGYEEGLGIYPSRTRGRVCLIYIGIQAAEFSLGTVVNGQIRTNQKEVILKQGEFLGIATVFNNKADIPVATPYHSPTVPQAARDFARSSRTNAQQVDKVVQEFQAAGCTATLPSRS